MAGDLVPYRGQKRHSGKSYADRLALGERVLAGRNNGLTMPMICRDLGISEDSGKRYLDLVLQARIPPTVDLYRRQQNDRLDQTQRAIEEQMDLANTIGRKGVETDNPTLMREAVAMRAQAIALQLRLDERRAKLNGLDAPVHLDVTVAQVDPLDAEMAEMVREAKAKMAAEDRRAEVADGGA